MTAMQHPTPDAPFTHASADDLPLLSGTLPAGWRRTFSARFEARPADARPLLAFLPGLAQSWVRDWYLDHHGPLVTLPDRGRLELRPGDGVCITDGPTGQGDGRLWTLAWRRAGERGASWRAELAVVLDAAHTRAEVTCVVAENGPPPRPGTVVPVPFVMRALVEDAHCFAGSVPVTTRETTLYEADVPAFVEEILCGPAREWPVVMVSPAFADDRPIVEPDDLARHLAGLAHVAALRDQAASFALTRALGGKQHSCYLGAIRIYQPGLRFGCDPFAHPLFVPDVLRSWSERGRPIADLLHARLTTEGAARYKPSKPLRRALEHASPTAPAVEPIPPPPVAPAPIVIAAPAAPPIEPHADAPDLDARVSAMTLEVLAVREELTSAREELSVLRSELSALTTELYAAADELTTLRTALATRPGRPDDALEEAPPASVLDAVERARERFGEQLVFLDSATASAADSPYTRPVRVLDALRALAEVCDRRREALASGRSMGGLKQAFEQHGFDYRSRESTTAKTRWASEYQAQFEGRRISIEEHLALGTGDANHCLRLHFHWDEPSRRFVVAHVGRHKTNTLS